MFHMAEANDEQLMKDIMIKIMNSDFLILFIFFKPFARSVEETDFSADLLHCFYSPNDWKKALKKINLKMIGKQMNEY